MSSVSIPSLRSSSLKIESITGITSMAFDTIVENTLANGVSVDGVLLINGDVVCDAIILETGNSYNAILDEDTMVSNSASALCSQQSIKSYVDTGSVSALQNTRSYQLFNGMSYNSFESDITSDGAIISISVFKNGGGNFDIQISGVLLTFTASSINLTAGTDTTPQYNYIWLYNNAGVATLNQGITEFPTGVNHVRVCTAVVQSAGSVQTNGPYKHHNWNEDVYNSTAGHLRHINAWVRLQHATWDSGVDQTLTITINGGSADNVILSTTEGRICQLHAHVFPAQTSEYYVVNDSVTPYLRVTDLNALLTDASGGTLSAKRFNLIIWGCQSSNDNGDCKLFVNLPTGSYGTNNAAINDANNYTVFDIPAIFKGTAFLISKLTLRHQTADSGTWTSILESDLRPFIPNILSGSGGDLHYWTRTGTDIFPVNVGDALLVDTINEEGSGNGVTIEGVVIKDSGIAVGTGFFHAYLTGDIGAATGDGTEYTILYSGERHDVGGNFNAGTGTFTVPTTGYYQFELYVGLTGILIANHNIVTATITANGVPYSSAMSAARDGTFSISVSTDVLLTSTQTVTSSITVAGNSKVAIVDQNTRFIGRRLGS